MKKLSVIVPIYNVGRFLEKCIQSICNQSYKNLEIILLDDGSTDESIEICDKFSEMDDRIIVIHKQNEKLVPTRKLGIKISTGEYIAFVDGDDWIEYDMYETLMEKTVETDVDMVDSGFVDEKSGKIQAIDTNDILLNDERRNEILGKWIIDPLRAEIRSTIWSKVYKKELIEKSYSNVPGDLYAEDIMNFIFALKLSKRIYTCNYCGYHYVTRNESYSNVIGYDILKRNLDAKGVIFQAMVDNYPTINRRLINAWYYSHVIRESSRIYIGDDFVIQKYAFENIDRLCNKKIVLYGAGDVGKSYFFQISRYQNCRIVAWVDSNPSRYKYGFCRVRGIEYINNVEYDMVIVAVVDKTVADEIKGVLKGMGISKDKIIWQKPLGIMQSVLRL